MRYLVAIVLTSALLTGQGVGLGHSHQTNDVSDRDEHAARPHIHLHGHHHHHDSEPESDVPVDVPANEHDGDAVYVSAAEMLPVLRAAQYRPSFGPSLDCVGGLIAVLRSSGGQSPPRWMWHGPPGGDADSSLSFRNCVLRC